MADVLDFRAWVDERRPDLAYEMRDREIDAQIAGGLGKLRAGIEELKRDDASGATV